MIIARQAPGVLSTGRHAISNPGARLIVYPETGHTPHWERPQQVTADLQAFVRAAQPRLRPQDAAVETALRTRKGLER